MAQEQAAALIAQLQDMKAEAQAIAQKIGELDQERQEHTLVAETLETLEGHRKCYRMIGGVLTERTVSEVLPAVTDNMSKLEAICNDLHSKLLGKEKEMQEFQAKHNIREPQKRNIGSAE